jgi:hypothetical protein
MCVIVAVDKDGQRPTPDHVDAFWEKNPEGAGIAWLDGKKAVFQKGLTLGEIQDLIKAAPLPFVAHFRIATCGGVLKRLTHPFIISEDSPLTLKGSSSDPLLFHNGAWHGWEKRAVEICTFSGWKLPDGPWTDSRLMAWFAAHTGLGILELIVGSDKQRLAILNPQKQKLDLIGEWTEDKVGKFWVSNELWTTEYWKRRGGKKAQKAAEVDQANPQKGEQVAQQSSALPNNDTSILKLTDPRTSLIGQTSTMQNCQAPRSDRSIPPRIGPAGFSASKDGQTEGNGQAGQTDSFTSGDPFPPSEPELSVLGRLEKLERIWVKVQETRMRHKMDRRRYKTLKNIYERRRKEIQNQLYREMQDEGTEKLGTGLRPTKPSKSLTM